MVLAGVGAVAASVPLGAVAANADPRSVSTVTAEARAYVGARLAGSPWQSYFGGLSTDWCAMFVSWLIREQNGPKSASSTAIYDFYNARGRTGSIPTPGALIIYTDNGARSGIFHIGIVENVSGGVASTIEGNTPGSLPYTQTYVKAYGQPWSSSVLYAYPDYSGSTSPNQPLPKGEQDVQYWKYQGNGMIAAVDNVRMEYRFINKYEQMVVSNLVGAGLTQVSTFSDPAWTETLGAFREIKAPSGY